MKYVFISYVREDKPFIDRICEYLQNNDVRVWIDRHQIMPGQRWQPAIKTAIENGAFFLACFSDASGKREKNYQNEEVTIAIDELRKRSTDRAWFIPVCLSPDAVPKRSIGGGEYLTDLQWVDLHSDWEGGLANILQVIAPQGAAFAQYGSGEKAAGSAQKLDTLIRDEMAVSVGFADNARAFSATFQEQVQRRLMDNLPRMVHERLPSLYDEIARRIASSFADNVTSSFRLQLRVGRQYDYGVVWDEISKPLLDHFLGSKSIFASTFDLSLLARKMSGPFTADALINTLKSSIIDFGGNSAKIPSDAEPFLKRTAAAINWLSRDVRIGIVGHAGGTGDSQVDLALSQARAEEVGQALVSLGVPRDMLVIKGFGTARGPYASALSEAMDSWVSGDLLRSVNDLLEDIGKPRMVMPTDVDQRIKNCLTAYVKEECFSWSMKWVFTLSYLPSKGTLEKIKRHVRMHLLQLLSSSSLTEDVVVDQLERQVRSLWTPASLSP